MNPPDITQQTHIAQNLEEANSLSAQGWILHSILSEDEVTTLISAQPDPSPNHSSYPSQAYYGGQQVDIPGGFISVPNQALRRVSRYVMHRPQSELVAELREDIRREAQQTLDSIKELQQVQEENDRLKKDAEASAKTLERYKERVTNYENNDDLNTKKIRTYEKHLGAIRKAIGTKQFDTILDEAGLK